MDEIFTMLEKDKKGIGKKFDWDVWGDAIDYFSVKLEDKYKNKVNYTKDWRKELRWKKNSWETKLRDEKFWKIRGSDKVARKP